VGARVCWTVLFASPSSPAKREGSNEKRDPDLPNRPMAGSEDRIHDDPSGSPAIDDSNPFDHLAECCPDGSIVDLPEQIQERKALFAHEAKIPLLLVGRRQNMTVHRDHISHLTLLSLSLYRRDRSENEEYWMQSIRFGTRY
jgi:hypothetical protein